MLFKCGEELKKEGGFLQSNLGCRLKLMLIVRRAQARRTVLGACHTLSGSAALV
jgi:hypothetical protein